MLRKKLNGFEQLERKELFASLLGGETDVAGRDGNDLLIGGDGSDPLEYEPVFLGGVYVAAGDINPQEGQTGDDLLIVNNGDGSGFLEAGPGGGPHVRVFDGITG